MANLLKGRKASHNPSYEGYDMSHYSNFSSSVGHLLPIHWDFLLPDDKVSISTSMKTIMQPLNSASPITIREHVDYYFVPLECLYSLFPSMLSNTNEDASSSVFDSDQFRDAFPLLDIGSAKYDLSESLDEKDRYYFDSRVAGFNRLIEFFEYGGKIYDTADMPSASQNMNVLLLQAYHAVWEYFFRDDKRVKFNPLRFNSDKYYGTNIISYSDVAPIGFFDLEYRPLKKDPYTIVSPSPLGGQNSLNGFDKSGNNFASYVKQWLLNVGDNPRNVPQVRDGLDGDYSGNYTDVSFPSSTYGFGDTDNPILNGVDTSPGTNVKIQQSLQQHRMAIAIEKLSSIWWTAGKSYKEQMEALFGAKHVRTPLDKPTYIGSDINEIVINPEVAAITTGSGSGDDFTPYTEAGSYTGRGYGQNTPHKSSFTAPCHGILLALYSAVPDAIYRQDVINVFNTYNKRNSFPNPVTDTLGEQPLFGFEVNSNVRSTLDMSMIGWLPRFHELKMKSNRAYGAFKNSLSSWLPTMFYSANALTSWYTFYTSPSMLDSIMLHSYRDYIISDATAEDSIEVLKYKYDFFDTDPLMHFFHVECSKGSKMNAYGVPNTYFG